MAAKNATRAAYLTLMLMFLGLGASPLRAQSVIDLETAQTFVNKLVTDSVEGLKSGGETLEAREALFRKVLGSGFAMPLIAKVALGKHWRRVKPAQRNEYTELFSEFMLKTYGPQISGFDLQRFQIEGAKRKSRGDALVSTIIDQPAGPPVHAQWRVRTVKGRPKVIDIVLEGISMTLTQRQQFSSVVKRDGMTGLIEMLRARVRPLPLDPSA